MSDVQDLPWLEGLYVRYHTQVFRLCLVILQNIHTADGTHTITGPNELSISLGKTDNDLWAHYFRYDPETLEQIVPENAYSEYSTVAYTDIQTAEYQDFALYQYEVTLTDLEFPSTTTWQRITWLDDTLGLCFSISTDELSEYTALDYAKILIDDNHPS